LTGSSSPFAKYLKQTPGPSSGVDTSKAVPVPSQAVSTKREAVALWPAQSELTLSVYVSTFDNPAAVFYHKDLPYHTFEPVKYGDWNWPEQTWETSFKVPNTVQNNGSLWLDMFLARNGAKVEPNFNPGEILHKRKLLSRYMPQKKIRAVKSLLSAANETEPEPEVDEKEPPIVSYYAPNLTLAITNDPQLVLQIDPMIPAVLQHVTFAPDRVQGMPNRMQYYPVLFPHEFWMLKEHLNPINETVKELPLKVNFRSMSYNKFSIFTTMDNSFKEAAKSGAGGGEMDEIKRMLTETNIYLLITTVVVTILHMVFEFLAFSSDVSHWRQKKEMVGVSVRTIITNCFVQLIILLYLMDNNENTSWMILFSQGMGLVIEGWKITKAVDIKLLPATTGLLPYKVAFHDKHVLSEEEKQTQEYDKVAFRLVSYGTVPLLVGYTIYSLIYETHRGWYSFVISTLTSFVYMFGFVQLIPQLIINYKLKSVAHLPMKSLIYKTLTTVVDDFFSFCIKMPWLHRLACFRDDVVFLVLLYQYWIYRVDPTRANEYGQVAAIGGKSDVKDTAEGRAAIEATSAKETKKDK